MKRSGLNLFLAAALVAATAVLAAPSVSMAEVNVSINIPLPGLVIPAPPGLIVIPGTYVYYPPAVGVDIFFYHGYWYRPYGGGWYIANGYNGPWRTVGPRHVPHALIEMPRDYRRIPPIHERVPYQTVHKNWRTWENERHWDNHDHGRGNHGEHRGHGHDEGHGEGHGHGHGHG
jgi:hypothetical protein